MQRYPGRARVARQVLAKMIKEAGYTWEGLSLDMGETPNYIWFLMHGRQLTVETWIAIALMCDADPAEGIRRIAAVRIGRSAMGKKRRDKRRGKRGTRARGPLHRDGAADRRR
jgi:hypothetical protein